MKLKDMKRLRRRDLLELLIDLSKENDALRARNQELETQLSQRTIAISEAGSLAEAALQLNGVFQAAQEACDQYMQNMQQRCMRLEAETEEKCQRLLNESRLQVEVYEKEDSE